jgi:hypothetical protein
MPGLSHHDTEVFERMADELRRAADELRQATHSRQAGSQHPAERLEAYAAAIVKDLQRAYG